MSDESKERYYAEMCVALDAILSQFDNGTDDLLGFLRENLYDKNIGELCRLGVVGNWKEKRISALLVLIDALRRSPC